MYKSIWFNENVNSYKVGLFYRLFVSSYIEKIRLKTKPKEVLLYYMLMKEKTVGGSQCCRRAVDNKKEKWQKSYFDEVNSSLFYKQVNNIFNTSFYLYRIKFATLIMCKTSTKKIKNS